MTVQTRLSKGGSRRIYEDVHSERIRANRKHAPTGDTMEEKVFDSPSWLSVVGEEFGEVCRVLCEVRHKDEYTWDKESVVHLRDELVQTAAMCCAWIGAVDEEIALWGDDDDA